MLKAIFRVTAFVALTSLLVACGDESKEIPDDIGHFELGDVNDAADTAEVAEDITDTEEVADDEDPGDTEEVADDAADTDDVPPEDTTEVVEPEPDPALPMRDDGWLRGDLHMHTTYSDGEDPGTGVDYADAEVALGLRARWARGVVVVAQSFFTSQRCRPPAARGRWIP